MKYIQHHTTRRYVLDADIICRYANLAAYFKKLYQQLSGCPDPKLEQQAAGLADLYADRLAKAAKTPANPTGELRNFWGIDSKMKSRVAKTRLEQIELILDLIREQRRMNHVDSWKFFDDDFLQLDLAIEEQIKSHRRRVAYQ